MDELKTFHLLLTGGGPHILRKMLLQRGTRRFGPPTAKVQAALGDIDNVEQLSRMAEWLTAATNWRELLRAA
jgi:hypothetical protein